MTAHRPCPWLKNTPCEALWTCAECLDWYYSLPAYKRALNHITHWFARGWEKVRW